MILHNKPRQRYEGHSEVTDTPFPERKRKIYSSTWDSIILRSSLRGWILLQAVYTKIEKKKVNFWKKPQTSLFFYAMMQSLIDWLNECSWRLLSTIAQPWTAPVSVLGHSWPTFSLSVSTSSVFPPDFVMSRNFHFCPVSGTPRGVSIISERPVYNKMMQSLIDWLNECNWHQLSTIAQPWNRPCLRA